MKSPVRRIVVLGRAAVAGVMLLVGIACVQVFRSVETTELSTTVPTSVSTPVKVHLVDGATVVYATGAQIGGGRIAGNGVRHEIDGTSRPTASVALDSVVGVETFQTKVEGAKSVLATVGLTAAAIVGSAALAVAVFGSCPTFYSDSANTPVLQGEGFSYAIAPLFEHRDIDRLRMTTGPDGMLRLEVRNEALETHYINHLELLEVPHAVDQTAVVDERGRPILLRDLRPLPEIRDRAGRNVGAELSKVDGTVFSSDPTLVAARTSIDLDDYLDLSIPVPSGMDSVAVTVRLRNSLLNTVLLYEEILAASGARSLDWMGKDLANISTALELGKWYMDRMGMRVSVKQGSDYRQVAKIADTGPIAYHDVAVVVPVSSDGRADVRLSFVADNWRIESVAYSSDFQRAEPRLVPLAHAKSSTGAPELEAARSLSAADDSYLQTSPGQSFQVFFDAGVSRPGQSRTFFLAAQGYYVEWMRAAWLSEPRRSEPFVPSDERLLAALKSWTAQRAVFEQRFYASKIPVR